VVGLLRGLVARLELAMAEAVQQNRPPIWRRRFYVHAIQKTYAIYLATYLFAYSLLVFGLAFFVPQFIRALKLYLPLPIEQRAVAATEFLAFAETMGPAVFALIIGSALFSIYLTHRLAGPLYRFERHAADLAEGDLSLRIRLRQGDELQELARMINETIEKLDGTLAEIRDREVSRQTGLKRTLEKLKGAASPDHQVLQQLELSLKEGELIGDLLRRFKLSQRS
jgi:methyl-accepting chemotaxis protein